MDGVTRLRAMLQSDPGNEPLSLEILDALIAAGSYDDGLAFAETLPAPLRSLPSTRLRVARCALSTSRLDVAIAELSAALEVDANSSTVRHDLAFALFCAGRRGDAEAVLAPVVVLSGEVPEIGLLHLRLLYHRGELDAAGHVVGVVTDTWPARADAWGLAALIHLDRGATDASAAAASQALAIDSQQADALLARGGLALSAGDAADALRCFDDVARRQPHSGRAQGGAGEARLLHGDSQGARPFLERASQLQPGHLGTWHALAWAQLLDGDVAGAETSFRKALDVDRNFGESHGGMAIVYALEGKAELADQAIRRAQRLSPQGDNARYAEGLLLSAAGRDAEADRLVRAVVATRAPGAQLPADHVVAHLRALMAEKSGS